MISNVRKIKYNWPKDRNKKILMSKSSSLNLSLAILQHGAPLMVPCWNNQWRWDHTCCTITKFWLKQTASSITFSVVKEILNIFSSEILLQLLLQRCYSNTAVLGVYSSLRDTAWYYLAPGQSVGSGVAALRSILMWHTNSLKPPSWKEEVVRVLMWMIHGQSVVITKATTGKILETELYCF